MDEFYEAIAETFKRGGNVIIPTFALERAQELLYYLSQGIAQGRLAQSTQVYLDSPMAISATEIFRRHPECFEPTTVKLFQGGHDPFELPGLHFTRETAESVGLTASMAGPSSWPARACAPAAACATTSSTISVATIRASCSSPTQPLGLWRTVLSTGPNR